MYLIEKGKKPKPVCRECKALHAAKDCPRRSEAIDWAAVKRAGDEFYYWAVAYQERRQREA